MFNKYFLPDRCTCQPTNKGSFNIDIMLYLNKFPEWVLGLLHLLLCISFSQYVWET